ncbi:uncharacterized protein LOC129968348 [Argiope bruennichi]|uniref:uncharacterized protein LOC129968348 n=1 Tax=Argiope bruennichi TaxID=94029 RepID=UPI00249505AA|nr:uncharacterized protein LOC129968348 [Argiope bruennichi]
MIYYGRIISRQFFDEDYWQEMSDFEKCCYANKKKNYEFFLNLGLKPQKPHFMKKVKNRKYLNTFKERNSPKKKIEKSAKLTEKVSETVQVKKKSCVDFHLKQVSDNFCEKNQSCKVSFQNLVPRTKAYLKNLETLQVLLERKLEKLEGLRVPEDKEEGQRLTTLWLGANCL